MSESPSANIQQAADLFWQVSSQFYELPEVSSYLLMMQDNQGKNVNEMLFALWFSQEYAGKLNDKLVASGKRRTRRTQKWVNNIRNTRRELEEQWQPPYPEKIKKARDAILETEINIEKLHQQKLVEGVLENSMMTDLSKVDAIDENLMLENLTLLCGEPESETDYLQLIMLWQSYMQT